VAARAELDKADFYAAAVYGSIVAAALIEPFREEHVAAETVALSVLATLAVFWMAHVWSAIVGERIHDEGLPSIGRAATIARSEWPLVEAAFGPVTVLMLGWAGVLGDQLAMELALVVCLLELFAWGVAVGRRAYSRWWAGVLTGLTNLALGTLLITLEIIVFH
jgi:hypothetical protein